MADFDKLYVPGLRSSLCVEAQLSALLHLSWKLIPTRYSSELSPLYPPTAIQMYTSILGSEIQKRQKALESSNATSPAGGGGRFVLVSDDEGLSAEFPWGTGGGSELETRAKEIVDELSGLEKKTGGRLLAKLRATVVVDVSLSSLLQLCVVASQLPLTSPEPDRISPAAPDPCLVSGGRVRAITLAGL